MKVECKKRPGAKGDASPPEAPVPPTPVPQASCGKTQGVAVLGRGAWWTDGDSFRGHEAFPIIPTSLPPAPPRTGSEDNLSYTLSLEPETGCHVRHAWTQTDMGKRRKSEMRQNSSTAWAGGCRYGLMFNVDSNFSMLVGRGRGKL